MLDLTLVTATDAVLPAEPAEVRHLIAGEWRASADGATFERRSPAHGVVVTRAAKGGAAETDAAIAAARATFDDGPWSAADGAGAGGAAAQGRRPDRPGARADRAGRDAGGGKADRAGAGRDRGRRGPLALCRGAGADAARRQPQQPRPGHARAGAQGADRGRLDHLPLELPLPDRQPEAALRARRRLHGGGEALGDDAVDHGDPRRAPGRGRAAGRASSTSCSATASRSGR